MPAWSISQEWGPNWTQQNASSLAGVVGAERVAWLSRQRRQVVDAQEGVRGLWPSSPELAFRGLWQSLADGEAAAAHRRALHGVARTGYRLVAPLAAPATGVAPGAVVRVVHPRWGLAAGRSMLVRGIRWELRSRRLELELWG